MRGALLTSPFPVRILRGSRTGSIHGPAPREKAKPSGGGRFVASLLSIRFFSVREERKFLHSYSCHPAFGTLAKLRVRYFFLDYCPEDAVLSGIRRNAEKKEETGN